MTGTNEDRRMAISILTRLQYAGLNLSKDSIDLLKMSGDEATDYLRSVLNDPEIENKIAPVVTGNILGMEQSVSKEIFLGEVRNFLGL